ncbi:MAG: ABC transporter permease [Myxococcales bacterium]|nr:ABC transporter permease [Myxococcales bacterium]
MISAIDRKLLRDLTRMRGQVFTIALVVACGIAAYATTKGTHYSLLRARDTYYERYRFPDVFAHLERAPDALRKRLESIDGIAVLHTRVLEHVNIPIEGLDEPATGHLVSIPADREPALGGLFLREGRMVEPGRSDEVVVLEAFALAHELELGDRLPVIINGIKRRPRVVGIALSPEYVFAISPGELMPDPRRFGVFWMDHELVSAAYEMEASFNNLVVRLQPGASERAVIQDINRLLEPYGGTGAYARDKQLSNNVLTGEIAGLEAMTTVVPMIFLGVAAFLINIVLSRLVQLQRPQIATLKAVGYSNRQVGAHYLKLVAVVVVGGSLIGVSAGAWLGSLMTDLYTEYFHFPSLHYVLDARILSAAIGISLGAAVIGALSAVRAATRLPPAEAMRPEPPAAYRQALSESLGLQALFGQAARMVLRELERRPLRTLLSALGIAMAVSVLVAGRFGFDAVDWFMEVQFHLAQREDLSVSFAGPVPESALTELEAIRGVHHAEGMRIVAARFRSGHRFRESSLIGHAPGATLRRVVDDEGDHHLPPERGVMLTRKLAEILEVRIGEPITVEVLEGQRPTVQLTVTGLVEEVFGLQGHMQRDALARVLREQAQISMAMLQVDPREYDAIYRELKRRPLVLGVNRREAAIEMFNKQMGGQMYITTLILTIFAAIIAGGVIYNNARVALSTRSRDLASLRVLGFRRREISAILLGELGLQVVLALVPGMIIGTLMAEGMMSQADPEMYRFPVMISPRTYAFAAVVTMGAALLSALLVRRRLDNLDLIAVLKTRE